MTSLDDYMKSACRVVEEALDRYLPPETEPPQSLHRAMRYSIFSNGKRLRPIMAIMSAEACGGNAEQALPAGCALEMIHTYSLIHDDLPAIDNDDFRRGRPTNHKVFGEAMAILAGDALLTHAFHILTEAPTRNLHEVLRTLTEGVGIGGMVSGQVVDVEGEKHEPDIEKVEYIHLRKTAAPFAAAAKLGALAANAPPEKTKALEEYGRDFGLAFQIVDDILNEVGDAARTGKPTGTDKSLGKQTYPAVVGIEKSKQAAHDYAERAKRRLEPFGPKGRLLKELADFILSRDR